MNSSFKKYIKFIFAISFSFLIIFFVFRSVNLEELKIIFRNANTSFIYSFIALSFFQFAFMGLKWRMMLNSQFKINLGFSRAVFHVAASLPPNIVIPGKVGEFLRVFWLPGEFVASKKITIVV